MQKALKSPHYKKIWEEVNWKIRHPSEGTLIDALLLEACYDGCFFIQDGYIGMPQVFSNDCGYAYAFNFYSDYQYKNNREISFYDDEERKKYDVNTGVLLEEYTEEILNKKRVLQHILGRPINIEDIILLFPTNSTHFIKNANSLLQIKIFGIDKVGCDFFQGVFDWQLGKPLDEQSPETWEGISKLIK